MKTAEVTALLGPQTRLGRALNDLVREARADLEAAGLAAFPSRVGAKALRDLADGADANGIRASLGIGAGAPVLLAAIKGLGAPAGTFRSRELLPDAEAFLAEWARLFAGAELHVVLTIDALPDLLATMDHATANAAVGATPWDALYEVSWAEIVASVCAAIPGAEVTVLTTRGAFVSAETVVPLVFGIGAEAISTDQLRRALLDAASDASSPRGAASLGAFFDAHAPRPPRDWLASELGLDAVTTTLLRDRFAEDLDAIRALPGVRLI